MKLSRQMRMNLNLAPDAEEGAIAEWPDERNAMIFYSSQLEPLKRRGLLTYETVEVMRPVQRFRVKLTELGRRIKYQNTDD